MTSTDIDSIPSDIDNLVTQIGDLNISDTFINIKPEVKVEAKPELNPHVTDIPSTSTNTPQSFTRPSRG